MLRHYGGLADRSRSLLVVWLGSKRLLLLGYGACDKKKKVKGEGEGRNVPVLWRRRELGRVSTSSAIRHYIRHLQPQLSPAVLLVVSKEDKMPPPHTTSVTLLVFTYLRRKGCWMGGGVLCGDES